MPWFLRMLIVRKACAFILAVFYLSFSIGATLHQHYCMGELVGASIYSHKDDECGKCGMKKHTESGNDCCKDVSITLKTNDSYTFSQPVYDFNSFSVLLPASQFATISLDIPEAQTENFYLAHSPPLLKHSLFLRFGNFRI
jgi:hypothetical protein